MSLGQALASATAGLRVTQSALSLTASNVANAETPGYVRKQLTQIASTTGVDGIGVRVESINRQLDQYLQRQLRVETSGGAYGDLRAQFYSRLQQIYGTPGSDTTLETIFNNFTTALQGLSTSPDASSARNAVLSTAQILAQQLNSMSSSIQGLRSDADLGLSDAVKQANAAMAQIANLNRQLAASPANDAAAASMKDQRDSYIDQLSQLMDIRVVATDRNQVNVFTNSGIQLVGTEAARLDFNPQGMMSATGTWNADPAKSTVGTLQLVSSSGGSYDLLANNAIRSGQIAAYVEMRDHILVDAQSQLDSIASTMAQLLSDKTVAGTAATVGPQSGFDIDVAGLLAGNTIHLDYTDTTTGQQHHVSLIRVDDPSALPLKNNVTGDPNDEVIGMYFPAGLASVASQLNSLFNGKVTFSNPSGTTLRILNDGAANTSRIDSVTATQTVTGLSGGSAEMPFFTDANTLYTGAITSLGSQSIGFAGRIVVNANLLADPTKLIAYQSGVFSGDVTRPNFLYNQLTQARTTYSANTGIGTELAPFSGSLPSFMREMVSIQGQAAADAKTLADGQNVVVKALQQRVADGSAVNIDEEMSNLLQLQTAYGANARVLSVIKDMFDTLLRM